MTLNKINAKENQPFMFYIHPWEIDPERPRINGANVFSRFRHYNNLSKTERRFGQLLKDFEFGPITTRSKEQEASDGTVAGRAVCCGHAGMVRRRGHQD